MKNSSKTPIKFKQIFTSLLVILMLFSNVLSVKSKILAEDSLDVPETNETIDIDNNDNNNDQEIDEEIIPEDTNKDDLDNDEITEELDEEETDEENEDIEISFPAFDQETKIDDVLIRVTADENVFPDNSTLHVEKISNSQQNQVDEAIEEVRNEELNVVVSYTFDIKVLDEEDNEIQPLDESKVAVSFTLVEAVNNNLEVQVYHVDDELNVVELDTEVNDDVVTVETDGFSFYTVEFTYNNLQYVLDGDEEIELSVILDALKLTGNVTNVEVSNSELFSYEDGIIYSHQPFDTEEWMKVTIDGIEFVIVVTDANDPVPVEEGVDFEHDIIYKRHFDAPKIKITGTGSEERTFNKRYTFFSTLVTMPSTATSTTIEVDYGVVGTIMGKNVKMKLTFSDFVYANNTDPQYKGKMQIYIGNNPQTGFVVYNIYLCKVVYSVTYEDEDETLENPKITFGSINGQSKVTKEGIKPINHYKVSIDSDSIVYQIDLLGGTGNPAPTVPSSYQNLKTGWFYSKYQLEPGIDEEDNADYIDNPLTGRKDKYNPKVAITAFYSDSSNMGAYITARHGSTWQNAKVIAHETTHDLKIEKTTDEETSEKFDFRLKIWREVETEKITIIEEEEFTTQAYAVFDSSNKTLTFFRDESGKYTNGQTIDNKTYFTNFENVDIEHESVKFDQGGTFDCLVKTTPPWANIRSQVTKVVFEGKIIPNSTDQWFSMASLVEIEGIHNLEMHKVLTAKNMFDGCTSLTALDTSNFYMPACREYDYMFRNCNKLTELNLKGFDFNGFYASVPDQMTSFTSMFQGCSKLTTELTIPCLPFGTSDVFKSAATASDASIKLYVFAATRDSMNTIKAQAGTSSHFTWDYVNELPENLPDYLDNEEISYEKEYHIFDLTKDNRFTYSTETQEYSFKLGASESITIENIPESYNYLVYEVDSNGNEVEVNKQVNKDWLLSSVENEEGTMEEDVTAKFLNITSHDITIEKETDFETEEKFNFKIKVWKDVEESYKSVAEYVFKDTIVEDDPSLENTEETTMQLYAKSYPIKIDEYSFTKHTKYLQTSEREKFIELGDYHNLWNVDGDYSADSMKFYPKENDYTGESIQVGDKTLYELNWSIEYRGKKFDCVYVDKTADDFIEAISTAFQGIYESSSIECYFYVKDNEDIISRKKYYESITNGNTVEVYYDLSEQLGEIDKDGYYSFELGTEEPLIVTHIPWGYKYEIIEVNEKGEKVSVGDSVNDNWALESITNNSGTIDKEDITTTFKNKSQVTYNIKVEKTISGEKPEKDSNFIFCLEGIGDAPMPEGSENNKKNVTVTGEGSIEFGDIESSLLGTYEYDVYEVASNETGYTYDDTKYHLVYEVTVGEDGFIVNRTVTANGEPYEDEVLLFDNEYEKPVTPETDVAIRVRKTLSGDVPENDSEFRFCLEGINDAPMPAGSNNNRKYVSITGRGSTEFGNIKFTSPGTYEYEAYEIDGRVSGYTYDTTKYHITYKVTLVDKELVVERTVTANGKTYTGTVLLFDNKYKKPSPSDDKDPYLPPRTGIE